MNSKTISYHGLEVHVRYTKPERGVWGGSPDQWREQAGGELYIDSWNYDDPAEFAEYTDGDVLPGKVLKGLSRPSEMDALWKKALA